MDGHATLTFISFSRIDHQVKIPTKLLKCLNLNNLLFILNCLAINSKYFWQKKSVKIWGIAEVASHEPLTVAINEYHGKNIL